MATAQMSKGRSASDLAKQQQRRIWRTAYLYILPAALIMLLITFWPLIYQFWMSFTEFSNRNLRTDNLILQMLGSLTGNLEAHNSPAFVGLGNYISILTGELAQVLSGFEFWRILLFNLLWTLVNVFFHVAIGIGVAVLINQDGLKGKRIYRSLYIIPWAMPGLVTAMVWRNMFDDQSGAINQLLRVFGLQGNVRWLQQIDPPFNWLPPFVRVPSGGDPFLFLLLFVLLLVIPFFFKQVRQRWLPFLVGWFVLLQAFALVVLPRILPGGAAETVSLGSIFPLSFYAVLITNIWLGWPFMMAIATGALQSIPRDMYEAAEVDGGSAWQQFWAITLPMIRPAMIPAIIVGMTMTFNQFNVFYFVSGGGPLHSTEILVTQAYRLVNETTVNLTGLGNVRPYGIAASFAYIVFLVLASITLITNKISRATESYAD